MGKVICICLVTHYCKVGGRVTHPVFPCAVLCRVVPRCAVRCRPVFQAGCVLHEVVVTWFVVGCEPRHGAFCVFIVTLRLFT